MGDCGDEGSVEFDNGDRIGSGGVIGRKGRTIFTCVGGLAKADMFDSVEAADMPG